ncbi:MAG: DUF1016 N-terminal domain-containing protein [Dysgonamonadaceae bacterium]|jgi:hypothetical protein|nr:DUF1016 N-terminal domain-containing protein [Dysgonamonadaceae bacterium]
MEIQKIEPDNSKLYMELLECISRKYVEGQAQAVRSVNETIIETNWSIGEYIVEYEQKGKRKAQYGKSLLEILSKDKDDLLLEYATYEMNSQLFVSKYQFYLPDKEELRKMISLQLESEE